MALYVVVIIMGIGFGAYPWVKGTSKVECCAKLYFSFIGVSALVWSFCGLIGSDKELPAWLSPERLQWIKAFAGGVSCGLAGMLAFAQLRRRGAE